MKTYRASIGSHIDNECAALVAKANTAGEPFSMDFNGQTIVAKPGDDASMLLAEWYSESERRSQAWLASPEYAAQQAEMKRKDEERAATCAAILARAPASMTLTNPDGWAKTVAANQDGYGAAALRYAERWALLMEAEIAAGKSLADCANATSQIADTEGITGFMHGCAVSILSQVWIHGAGLRAATA